MVGIVSGEKCVILPCIHILSSKLGKGEWAALRFDLFTRETIAPGEYCTGGYDSTELM
jgi:hypothetical protein